MEYKQCHINALWGKPNEAGVQLSMKESLTASTPGEAQPQISYSATGKKESHMSRKPAAKPQHGHKHLMKGEV